METFNWDSKQKCQSPYFIVDTSRNYNLQSSEIVMIVYPGNPRLGSLNIPLFGTLFGHGVHTFLQAKIR